MTKGPFDLHGVVAVRQTSACLHNLVADLPVLPASPFGAALLPEDLHPPETPQVTQLHSPSCTSKVFSPQVSFNPLLWHHVFVLSRHYLCLILLRNPAWGEASAVNSVVMGTFCIVQGHAGAQQEDSGSPEDQCHAASHRHRVCSLLAPSECLQHSVWLASSGPAEMSAWRCLLRLPPYSHGLHVHQPRGVRLPQQQLPAGAEDDAAALPVWHPGRRELWELPFVYGGQRGHNKGHFAQQDGISVCPLTQTWDQLGSAIQNITG